jgi:hypothetical protein
LKNKIDRSRGIEEMEGEERDSGARETDIVSEFQSSQTGGKLAEASTPEAGMLEGRPALKG